MDFSAAEIDRGVKFCMCVLAYYPGRSSPILEVKGQGYRDKKCGYTRQVGCIVLICYSVTYIEIAVGNSELVVASLLKAVWWDLRLASLLTHLLFCYSNNFYHYFITFSDV